MDDLALLTRTRGQLLADLARVADNAVDFEPVPGARTIAESLLHVAAVEFVFAAALALRVGKEVPHDLWGDIKAGLATEVGYEPPSGVGLEECVERLGRVRALLTDVCPSGETVVDPDELLAALWVLGRLGADLAPERISHLHPKLASHVGEAPVGVVLTAHEEYHRGQILYQNFLSKRALATP